MKPDELICSRAFRETILTEYPALRDSRDSRDSRALRRLFAYLAFGTWRCRYTDNLMIPADVLAHLEEKEYLLNHGNYVGQHYLDRFSERVARISCNESIWVADLCRTVRWVEWSPVAWRAICAERWGRQGRGSDPSWQDDRVFFTDGRQVTRYAVRAEREKLRHEAMKSIALAGCPDAERLLRYLNSRSPNRYTKMLANLDTAMEVARSLPKKKTQNHARNHVRDHALNTLRAIRDQPMPFYQASPRQRTVRIFPLTASLLTLKSCVRRVLTPDWVDLDLQSAQAAIVARDWGIDSLQAFLLEKDQDQSLWEYLMDQLEIEQDRRSEIKPALKDALYATIFGSEERNICWHFSHDAGKIGLGRRFLNLPLLQDILAARERRMEEAIEAGGARNIYDTWVPLPSDCAPEKAVRSVLAQCAQAAEMKLLAPVIDLALEWEGRSSGFDIVLWQHDGFSFVPNKSEDRQQWIHRLQRAVQCQADALGYTTRLVVSKGGMLPGRDAAVGLGGVE